VNTKLKKLKDEHDGKSVGDCVQLAKELNLQIIENGEKLINILWYLEKTKRYKEYGGYKKLGFDVFVGEICMIPYNRYRQMAYAYNWFPAESREFGPQTIQKIRENVTSIKKLPEILDEIKKKTAKIRNPLKKREIISGIIKSHSAPKKESDGDTKSYWRQKYKDLWDKYQVLVRENNELSAQLSRQMTTVERIGKIKEVLAA